MDPPVKPTFPAATVAPYPPVAYHAPQQGAPDGGGGGGALPLAYPAGAAPPYPQFFAPPQYGAGAQPNYTQPPYGYPGAFSGNPQLHPPPIFIFQQQQQPPSDDAIYANPQNWRCGRYHGVGDSRFCVPNPDCQARSPAAPASPNRSCCAAGCCCQPVVPNHAHPHCRRLVAVAVAVVIVLSVARTLLTGAG